MTTSILSFFHTGLFRKFNFLVSQLKHLTLKTTSLEIYKMRAGIFYGDIYRKLDLIFESLLDFQSFLCTLCHLSIIVNQSRYSSSRLLIPMFIGSSCT